MYRIETKLRQNVQNRNLVKAECTEQKQRKELTVRYGEEKTHKQ